MKPIDMAIISGGKSKLHNVTWPHDKYPDMPEFGAGTKLVVLDEQGPGMITNIHVSTYYEMGALFDTPTAGSSLWLRVFYDQEETPSIDMPLMDFLGDVQASAQPFATVYFSKVKHSHNFYMVMPFRSHIRVELENKSERALFGYATLQTEALDAWDDALGYLYVDYRTGTQRIPDEPIALMDARGDGVLVAHWLQIRATNSLCKDGNYLCEANDEIYVDGEAVPSHECLGTEDFYGYSWGFHGVQSDGRCAIFREEDAGSGSVIGMLRCRVEDRVRFTKSMRVAMDYGQEFFSAKSVNPEHVNNLKASFRVEYLSCYYYYAKRDCATRNCATRDCATRDCATRDCATRDCATRDCATRDCATRDCATQEDRA